jgi:hypothetical protein
MNRLPIGHGFRFVSRHRNFLILPLMILLILGCTVERNVRLSTRLSVPPAFRPLPVHVGLFYESDIHNYKKRIELIGCGPHGRRDHYDIFFVFPVGEASRELFDQIAASMFRQVTVMANPSSPSGKTQAVDGFLELRIDSFEWGTVCTKDYLSTGKYFANVGYVISLYDADGRFLVSIPVNGTAIEKPKPCWKDCRDSPAAQTAIRDAAARFMVTFPERPEVREWLSRRRPGSAAKP